MKLDVINFCIEYFIFSNADGSIMSPQSYSGETSTKFEEDLTADEIDEIDTKNMEVYSGSSKKIRSASSTVGTSSGSSELISAGESLLNSAKSPEQPLDVDTMLNVLNDPGQAVGTSTMSDNSIMEKVKFPIPHI